MTTAESPLSRARLASRPIASRSAPVAPVTEADRATERGSPPALTRRHVGRRGHPPGTPESSMCLEHLIYRRDGAREGRDVRPSLTLSVGQCTDPGYTPTIIDGMFPTHRQNTQGIHALSPAPVPWTTNFRVDWGTIRPHKGRRTGVTAHLSEDRKVLHGREPPSITDAGAPKQTG